MPKFIDYYDRNDRYYSDNPRECVGYDKAGEEIWEDHERHELVYATERQTLAFANKLREAGGGDVLAGLMPSSPGSPRACLIANALNFGCEVKPRYSVLKGYEKAVSLPGNSGYEWEMVLPYNLEKERAQAIAKAVGSKLRLDCGGGWLISLPPAIGNVARAFDRRIGWTKKYIRVSPNPCADV